MQPGPVHALLDPKQSSRYFGWPIGMRRPTRKAREYGIRVTRKRTARRFRKKSWRLSPFGGGLTVALAPIIFDIWSPKHRSELASFFATLRKYAELKMPVLIDFRRTRRMIAGGTLLLAAEIDRLNQINGPLMKCTYPASPVVAQVLQHVGIFDMLRQTRRCEVTAKNVKYWRVHSGELVLGQTAAIAIADYANLLPTPEQVALYNGLVEAMTNAHQHAYEEERGDGLANVPKWWMFSHGEADRIVVAICDLGIGIPRSVHLDRHGQLEPILKILGALGLRRGDGSFIKGAMELGFSRTKEENRGKGMSDIRKVLDGLQGRLQVHSNRGVYIYDASTGKDDWTTLKASILGTVLLWMIPVGQSGS